MAKLNLGCGRVYYPGWINVDCEPILRTDLNYNLERIPWPWKTNSVSEVRMIHVLHQLGHSSEIFFGIMSELYRICRPEALVVIVVPHHRHELFFNDPYLTRPITVESLKTFSKAENENTRIGIPIDVDFKITEVNFKLDAHWQSRVDSGQVTPEQIADAARNFNNVVLETTIILTVKKELPDAVPPA